MRAAGTQRPSPTRYRAQNPADREKSEPSSINSGLMGVHFTLLFVLGDPLPPLLSRRQRARTCFRRGVEHPQRRGGSGGQLLGLGAGLRGPERAVRRGSYSPIQLCPICFAGYTHRRGARRTWELLSHR